jgi:hypothetical protein
MRSYQRIAMHADMQLLLLLLLRLQLVHCDNGHRLSSYHSGHISLSLHW